MNPPLTSFLDLTTMKKVKRILVTIAGVTVLAVGIALVVLPGPAFLVIPAGLAILAIEFAWARRWLHSARNLLRRKKPMPKKGIPDESPGPANARLEQHRSTTRAVTVGSMAMLMFAGCGKAPDASAQQPNLLTAIVRVQTVEVSEHIGMEEVVGTVRAKTRASIEARVTGRIVQMLVTPGQSVQRGELLAQLEVQEMRARLDQAIARNDQAERELQRYTALLQQEAATPQEFDAVQARQRVAHAIAKEAETVLGYARLTAPFDGVITRKLADVGDLAMPGKPVLEMQDPTTLRFEADVPEALIDCIRPGAKLVVLIPNVEQELTGTVSEISPAADPNSRTVRVKLELTPTARGLRTGQFGRVAVPLAERTVLRIPASAVTRRGQLEIVFVIAHQKAQLRLVRIGTDLELISGVTAGEQVVIEGAARLMDGQQVEVRP